MKILSKAELFALPDFTKITAMHDGKKVRAMKEDDKTIFVYAKGKKRYGYRFSYDYFLAEYQPCMKDSSELEKQWHRRLKRAIKLMDENGLWTSSNFYRAYKDLLTMSYDDWKAAKTLYWDNAERKGPAMQAIIAKYPFLLMPSGDIDTVYIFELSECKLKSMWFGYANSSIKQDIADAIKTKKQYRYDIRANYDVSFEYNGVDKAWYSEEYRDCGNGHYYLAIGNSTCLFAEDD